MPSSIVCLQHYLQRSWQGRRRGPTISIKEPFFPIFLHLSSSSLIRTQASLFASYKLPSYSHSLPSLCLGSLHSHLPFGCNRLVSQLLLDCTHSPTSTMPSTMFSRIAVLFTLIASAVTQDDPPQPSTTPALQSFLEISNLDASQVCCPLRL